MTPAATAHTPAHASGGPPLPTFGADAPGDGVPPALGGLPLTPGVELKDHVKEYQAARRATHRAFLVTGVASAALLGLARTPKLVAEKLSSGFGELATPGDHLPIPSYAVVLGLVAVPLLVHWCYGKLIYALRLRRELEPLLAGLPDGAAVAERLGPPLVGSVAARRASWVARAEAGLTVFVAAAAPVIASLMMLWDFSHKFSFDAERGRYNGPFALWVTPADGGVRPSEFDNVPSLYHPALFPWWQPWAYLALILWAGILNIDGCLRLGRWDDGIRPVAAGIRTLIERIRQRR